MQRNGLEVNVYSNKPSSIARFFVWMFGVVFALSICFLISVMTARAVAGMVLTMTLPVAYDVLTQEILSIVATGVYITLGFAMLLIVIIIRSLYDS